MTKTVITYGLISGAIMASLLTLTSLVIGFEHGAVGALIGYTGMLIAFIVIYFGMVSYRDNFGNGQISFGKALAIGLLIGAISCVCYVITWIILYHTMFPDFMDKYSDYIINKMKAE